MAGICENMKSQFQVGMDLTEKISLMKAEDIQVNDKIIADLLQIIYASNMVKNKWEFDGNFKRNGI